MELYKRDAFAGSETSGEGGESAVVQQQQWRKYRDENKGRRQGEAERQRVRGQIVPALHSYAGVVQE